MNKINIKLKECCLTCENFDPSGIKGLSPFIACCGEPERVIACGHMEVCWKYNAKELDSQIPQKPINVKKQENKICNATCPSCGYNFPDIGGAWESYGEVEQYPFCPECGQKIDWEEKSHD